MKFCSECLRHFYPQFTILPHYTSMKATCSICEVDNKNVHVINLRELINSSKHEVWKWVSNKKPLDMKPFNLEKALAGDPVITRDGRKVTIAGYNPTGGKEKVAGWIACNPSNAGWKDIACFWDSNGGFEGDTGPCNPEDLFMAPKQRTLWVNLFPKVSGRNPALTFDTEKDADVFKEHRDLGKRIGKSHPITITE